MREECGLLLEAIPVLKDLPKRRRQELCNVRTLKLRLPCGGDFGLQGNWAKVFLATCAEFRLSLYNFSPLCMTECCSCPCRLLETAECGAAIILGLPLERYPVQGGSKICSVKGAEF